jgi:hypothetical protein
MQVFMKCPTCKQEYELGVAGTTAGCDVCQGIVRASNGFVIFPKETSESKKINPENSSGRVAQNEKAPAL